MKRKVLKRIVVTIMAMTMVTTQLPVDALASAVVRQQDKQQTVVEEYEQDEVTEIVEDVVDTVQNDNEESYEIEESYETDGQSFGYNYEEIPTLSGNALDDVYVLDDYSNFIFESDLDEKYDLRNKNRVKSTISNQGRTGTCWAHSSLEAVESNLITKGIVSPAVNYSEAHLTWFGIGKSASDVNDPLYGDGENLGGVNVIEYIGKDENGNDRYKYIHKGCFSRGGNEKDSVAALASGIGPVLEDDFGIHLYDYTREDLQDADVMDFSDRESERYNSQVILVGSREFDTRLQYSKINTSLVEENDKVENYVIDFDKMEAIRNEVKHYIKNKGALATSYWEDFEHKYSDKIDGIDNYFYCNYNTPLERKYVPNHGVAIIGWNDTIPSECFVSEKDKDDPNKKPPGPGAWIIKNSHGNTTNGGCFYMSYYDTTIMNSYTFEVEPRNKYGEKIYQYSGANLETTFEDYYPFASNVIGVIYTAEPNTKLTAVGFDNMAASGDPYEVYIYSDIEKNADNKFTTPIGKKVLYSCEGTLNGNGYIVVDFDKEVAIPSGTDFSVVVYFKNGGAKLYKDGHKYGENRSFVANISDGEAQEFKETSGYDINIKAFTASEAKKLSEIVKPEDIVVGRAEPLENIKKLLPETVKIKTTDGEERDVRVIWNDEINSDEKYTESENLDESFSFNGFVVLPDDVYINGKSGVVTIDVKTEYRDDLKYVLNPSVYIYPLGTSTKDIVDSLPKYVPVETVKGNIYQAEVVWRPELFVDTYNPNSKEEYILNIFGSVKLPKEVTNTNKVYESAIIMVNIKDISNFEVDFEIENDENPEYYFEKYLNIKANERCDLDIYIERVSEINMRPIKRNVEDECKIHIELFNDHEVDYYIEVKATLRGSNITKTFKKHMYTDGRKLVFVDNNVLFGGVLDGVEENEYIKYIGGKPYFCNLPVAEEPGKEFVCWTYEDKEIHNGDDASWVKGNIILDPKWNDITLWTGQQYDVTDVYKDIIAAHPDTKYRVKTNNKKAKASSKNDKYIITAKSAGTVEAGLQYKDGKKWKDAEASKVSIQVSKAKVNVKTIDKANNASLKVTDIIGQLPSELYNSVEISCVNPKKKAVLEYNSETGMITALEKGKASIVVKLTRDDVTKVYKFKIKVK